jgi:hypothetical protein
MGTPTLSALLLVRDEVELIDLYLENTLPYVDQLVVVDGGSTDGTLERLVARRSGQVKLLVWPQAGGHYRPEDWREPDRRNLALDLCDGDFVLKKDADEFFLEEDYAKMRGLMAHGLSSLYAFPRLHFWGDPDTLRLTHPTLDVDWYPDFQPNFWPKAAGLRYDPRLLHCIPHRDGQAVPAHAISDLHIYHYHWALGKRRKPNDLRSTDLGGAPDREPEWARPEFVRHPYRGPHPEAVWRHLGRDPEENARRGAAWQAVEEKLVALAADAEECCRIGRSNLRVGLAGAAGEAYRLALFIAPDHPEGLRGLAESLVQAGRPREAIALYRDAVQRGVATKRMIGDLHAVTGLVLAGAGLGEAEVAAAIGAGG